MSTKIFLISAAASLLFIFLPIGLSFLSWAFSGFSGSMISEGPGGHGAYIWLMMFTLPIGSIALFVISIIKIVSFF